MRVLRYRMKLLEPVLLSSIKSDENTSTTSSYISGTALRGAMISRYIRFVSEDFDVGSKEIQRLFFNNEVFFLNGYILRTDRMLPSPLSFRIGKKRTDKVFDFSAEIPGHNDAYNPLEKETYVLIRENELLTCMPDRLINIHTARTRRFGRAVSENILQSNHSFNSLDNPGAIYRYEALAPDQIYEAYILYSANEDLCLFEKLLDSRLRIGASTSAGYGLVEIKDVTDLGQHWKEVSKDEMSFDMEDEEFTVTLLSQAAVLNNLGDYSVDPEIIKKLFSEYLDMPLGMKTAFIRPEIIGGFNKKWGLPMPQIRVFSAGSVFKFEFNPDFDPQKMKSKLDHLEVIGIGDKRSEGFGRIAINWHGFESELNLKDKTPMRQHEPVVIQAKTNNQKIVKLMLSRRFDRMLDTQISSKAITTIEMIKVSSDIQKGMNVSQLSRLRAIVQNNIMNDPMIAYTKLNAFKDNVNNKKISKNYFHNFHYNKNTSMLNWLINQVKPERQILSEIGIEREDFPSLGNIKYDFTEEYEAKVKLRYIYEVISGLIKDIQRGRI